ncbi:hypothetical protein Tco_1380293, partial [Tanacetum coccineum]
GIASGQKEIKDDVNELKKSLSSKSSTYDITKEVISAIEPELKNIKDHWKRISHKRTKNKTKNDKTKHGMEMCEKTKPNQSLIVNQAKKSIEKSNSQSQSQPRQSQSQLREAEAENTT